MEPERRIEKLLRAFAKKRREQAGEPAALRPAARQRLQQEISRRSAAKSGGGFLANLFSAFQPRLAYALCAIAIVIVGGWFVFSDLNVQKNSTYAGLDTLSTASKEKQPEIPPTLAPMPAAGSSPATAPVTADADGNRGGIAGGGAAGTAAAAKKPIDLPASALVMIAGNESSKPVSTVNNAIAETNAMSGITVAAAPSAPPPALKTEPVAADSFAGASTLNKDVANRALQPIAPPQVATTPRPAAPPALAKNTQGKFLETQKASSSIAAARPEAYDFATFKNAVDLPANTQRFNRADAISDKRALGLINTPTPVLTSFRVEQTGNQLRVVDADGSVYTGAMQPARDESVAPAASTVSPKNKPTTSPIVRTSPQEAAQNYFFSVAGTNRNLNQNVVFSGNLIPFTNGLTPGSNASAFGGALRTRRAAEVAPTPSLLSNSRISGKAVIGNQKEIEVNATPAP